MTPHMADDEVLRVLGLAYYAIPDNRADLAEQLHQVARYVAALQAERDALRGKLAGETARAAALEALAEQTAAKHNEACEWAERDRTALEALRGQVEGLVEKWRDEAEANKHLGSSWHATEMRQLLADELEELLAIKERMG